MTAARDGTHPRPPGWKSAVALALGTLAYGLIMVCGVVGWVVRHVIDVARWARRLAASAVPGKNTGEPL